MMNSSTTEPSTGLSHARESVPVVLMDPRVAEVLVLNHDS